jgi:hypothetical protein
MVSNLDDLLGDMKEKYKNLRKKHVSLQEFYEELKSSHENLLDTHEKVKEAHNSHISQEANKVKVDIGITCDLLDDMTKIDEVLKSSISTSFDDLLAMSCSSNIDSCMNLVIHCLLLKIMNWGIPWIVLPMHLQIVIWVKTPITRCGSVKGSLLKHEGFGYIPKKNKSAFVDKKTTFIKECDLYYPKCKNTGHLDKNYTSSKIIYASIDPSYVLVKSSKGDVYDKFVGKNRNHAHISNNGIGTKRKSI